MTPEQLEREIQSLAGEIFALQAILVHVFRCIRDHDPRLAAVLRDGLDHTANFVQDVTIAHSNAIPLGHLSHAFRVVEEIRAIVLDRHDKPKHGV